jgi:hypothetical protein
MSVIRNRIAKLEELSRDQNGVLRVPGISDDEMSEIRRVAYLCGSAEELAAFLRSRLPDDAGGVVSLEDRRRNDAVLAAAARAIFDEINN